VTRRHAFLSKPSALGPDLTWWQLVDNRRQYLNNSSGQAAVGAVKVRTAIRLALCCESEDLCRLKRSRHREHIGGCEKRLIEVRDFRPAGSLLNDTEHSRTFYPRL
jgi:hypothetical protein